jgi:hypothetical protein
VVKRSAAVYFDRSFYQCAFELRHSAEIYILYLRNRDGFI